MATDSPDHLVPRGTRKDCSRHRRFNRKAYALFGYPTNGQELRVLDLGCAGGGFVADCLEDGCLAVGIEGSDYSRRIGRAEWSQIPDYLFCADITAPFTVAVAGAEPPTPVQFDLITMCEVIEHIAEADLPQVAENIRRHLAPGGLCVLSVAPYPDSADDVAWHQTVRPREWWLATFAALGFQHLPAVVEFFNGHFVRGPQQKSPGSFHLVLTTAPDQAPPVPRCGLGQRLMDRWQGSRWQRRLRQLVLGDGPLGDG